MIGRSLTALSTFAALALALHAGSAHARVDAPAEVQYFWAAPAEIAALDALRDAYRERGGTWVGYATANSGENRRLGFHRILEGLPPFALQWHAGNELRPLYRNAVIFDLAPIAARGEWTRTLHPEVLRYIQHGDGYFGLPVGIHGENWAWFNNAMLASYGVSTPYDWRTLEDMLARMQADGRGGIAMGTGSWQRRFLFDMILISEGGKELHRALYENNDSRILDTPQFRHIVELFGRLRAYDRRDPSIATWAQATAAVGDGRALVQFMGDWALRELTGMGLQPDRDFSCVLSPGKHKQHISVIDIFIFPVGEDFALTERHHLMAEAFLSEQSQISFARRKGAIPVRSDVAGRIGDPCLDKAYTLFQTPGASVPSPTMFADETVIAAISETVDAYWDDRTMDADAAIAALHAVLDRR